MPDQGRVPDQGCVPNQERALGQGRAPESGCVPNEGEMHQLKETKESRDL